MVSLSGTPSEYLEPPFQERMNRVALSPHLKEMMHLISHAVVVGCGGTGWHVAMTLALADLCRHITLYDGEVVEEVNLNRLPCPASKVGVNKAVVLAAEILRMRPNQVLTAREEWFSIEGVEDMACMLEHQEVPQYVDEQIRNTPYPPRQYSAIGGYTVPLRPVRSRMRTLVPVIFDCTDNPVFQEKLATACCAEVVQPSNLVYTRVSYDGVSHITVKHTPGARILNERAGRYEMMPSWSLPAQLAAVLGVYSTVRTIAQRNGHRLAAADPLASIGDEYGRVLYPQGIPTRKGARHGQEEEEQAL
jgi:hypothetical protein